MPLEILKEVAPTVAIVLIFTVYLYYEGLAHQNAMNAIIREHRESVERIVVAHEEAMKAVVLDASTSHKEKTIAFLQSENRSKDLIEKMSKEFVESSKEKFELLLKNKRPENHPYRQ